MRALQLALRAARGQELDDRPDLFMEPAATYMRAVAA
jgi:hypothetical protein